LHVGSSLFVIALAASDRSAPDESGSAKLGPARLWVVGVNSNGCVKISGRSFDPAQFQ
jgi:hypothetical protein